MDEIDPMRLDDGPEQPREASEMISGISDESNRVAEIRAIELPWLDCSVPVDPIDKRKLTCSDDLEPGQRHLHKLPFDPAHQGLESSGISL